MQRVREQVQVPEQLHSGAGRVKSVTVAVLDTGIAIIRIWWDGCLLFLTL